jgi:hypothetical protein
MNTLFTFGCSYTADYWEITNLEYKNFKGGNLPDVWPKVLSKKLNMDLKNYGEPSIGNDQIFHNFCKHVDEIKENDIVIIGWSFICRHRWLNTKNQQWMTIGVGTTDSELISQRTNDEIYINRSHKPYINDVYDYEKIIDLYSECKNYKTYYWSGDKEIIYKQPKELLVNSKYIAHEFIRNDNEIPFNEVFRRGGELIIQETNGQIKDHHMGESGHRIMAELFYECLNK